MMWGGVDASALARSVPMSIVDGSTRPAQDDAADVDDDEEDV